MKIPLIIIVGPTATGKSDLAVRIARKGIKGIKGEVISADSRQVYKGLDIGTGKITKREMKGVAHHLLDVADPRIPANSPRRFNVEKWRAMAARAIEEIRFRGHIPIICGGTGFYIEALVDGVILPEVPANPRLRAQLEKKSTAKLFGILQKIDPRRAREMKKVSNGDSQNPHRLIRAIEIATALGKVPAVSKTPQSKSPYAPIFIGLTLPPEELKKKIAIRLKKRIADGMIAEARRLHKPIAKGGTGLSLKRMNELGLEYRHLARYLQSPQSAADKKLMTEKIAAENWQYARRQMAWFRRDKRIRWFTPSTIAKNIGKKEYLTKVLKMVA
jgi:tRNA dimethylallyltransferase